MSDVGKIFSKGENLKPHPSADASGETLNERAGRRYHHNFK